MEPLLRVSMHNPCPVCFRADWCGFNDKVVVCMRVPSERPSRNGGWVHKIGIEKEKYEELLKSINSNRAPRRDDSSLDKVYRKLLSLLELSSKHRRELRGRGMTDEEIEYYQYRTLPKKNRSSIVRRLIDYDLSGVPGFGLRGGRWILAGPPGLLIPVMSPEKKIVSFQVRPDQQLPGRKYLSLSSSWLDQGSSPGVRIHAAVPRCVKDPALWITEGPIKANIAAERLGAIFWSVLGVNNWSGIFSYFDMIPSKVVIAYDQENKPQVNYHRDALRQALFEVGVDVFLAVWDRGKGIDDALVAGVPIRKLTH